MECKLKFPAKFLTDWRPQYENNLDPVSIWYQLANVSRCIASNLYSKSYCHANKVAGHLLPSVRPLLYYFSAQSRTTVEKQLTTLLRNTACLLLLHLCLAQVQTGPQLPSQCHPRLSFRHVLKTLLSHLLHLMARLKCWQSRNELVGLVLWRLPGVYQGGGIDVVYGTCPALLPKDLRTLQSSMYLFL